MPFFKPKAPPQNDVDVILDSISKGQFDDETINELQRLVDLSDDDEVDRIAESLLSNIMKTDDRNVLIGTVKALTVLPFLPEGKDDNVIRLMVTLFAVPQNNRITMQHKMLQNEILKFLLSMLKTDDLYGPLMMTELIASLEYVYIAKDADAYPALEILAAKRPEYFRPHAETLVKLLGSINKTTRAQSAKLIGTIGTKYPEYVSGAMPVLQSLASFYPDAQVKHNASEAYQILYHGLRLDVVETVAMKEDDKPKQRSTGFADILKKKAAELLSKPPQDTPGERQRAARTAARERLARERSISARAAGNLVSRPPHQSESSIENEEIRLADMVGFESEIKDILDKTRDDFTHDAEGILNSIGVGHLSVKNRDKLTITPGEELSGGNLPSSGGMASQPPEAEKQPIHARSAHLDGKAKPGASAVHTAHGKVSEHGDTPGATQAHGSPIRAGFKTGLHGDAEARDIQKPSGLVRTSANEKATIIKPASRGTIRMPHTGTKERHDVQTLPSFSENKPADAGPAKPADTEATHANKPAKLEEPPAKLNETPSVRAEPGEKTAPEETATVKTEPVKTQAVPAEKPANIEPVKPAEAAVRSEEKPVKPAEAEIPQDKAGKESIPQAKRIEKAMAWAEKSAAHELSRRDDTAAKRVEKAIAWFEKVGVPEPAPKATHHAGVPQPARESAKASPEPQPHASHAKPVSAPGQQKAEPQPVKTEAVQQPVRAEPHATIKPEAATKPEATKMPNAEVVPEKHVPPKHEHKIESSVLPPRAAVSKHEKVSSMDSITPTAARKISVSRIGMTDKPMESYGSAEESKKEAVVPGTSISGFGQGKNIYKCPKCGARTLVEGELCKICKMTMERPQEMVRCERCGLMNNRNARFCRKCGARLEKSTKPPE